MIAVLGNVDANLETDNSPRYCNGELVLEGATVTGKLETLPNNCLVSRLYIEVVDHLFTEVSFFFHPDPTSLQGFLAVPRLHYKDESRSIPI
jgi:hypothetical protein